MFKPGLFSLKQLFAATLIGGPLLAGFVMAMNLWARGKRGLTIIPILSGMLLDSLRLIPVYFSVPVRTGSVSEIMEINIKFR